ncbi:hypothetical protein DCCM_0892 [Desulfocucumis palustris]|uniref:Uncharacterized protein n=1 Tax=Desulfocucumis palustris TaxID=1898651 RepID=A0A2L2XEN1_9FIRM|nr:hypothetical protein DCCM_0892 [Desulfocucumis palustris]
MPASRVRARLFVLAAGTRRGMAAGRFLFLAIMAGQTYVRHGKIKMCWQHL